MVKEFDSQEFIKNPAGGKVTHFVSMHKTFDQINKMINSNMLVAMERHDTVLKVDKFYQGSYLNSGDKYTSVYPKRTTTTRAYINTSTMLPHDYGLILITLHLDDYILEQTFQRVTWLE